MSKLQVRFGSPTLSSRRWGLLAGLIVVAYLSFASLAISLPGLYYDEVVQIVPAIAFWRGGLPSPESCCTEGVFSFFGHPFVAMTTPYTGVVKTIAYLPVAWAFNTSPASIRLFTVGVGALVLLSTYVFTARITGRFSGVLATAFLAADPSLIGYARVDYGPVVFTLLLKMTALICFLRWWRQGRNLWLVTGAGLFGLGIYDKVSFIWIVGASLISALMIAPRELAKRISTQKVALASGSFLLGCLPVVIYNLANGGRTLATLFEISAGPSGSLVTLLGHRLDVLQQLLRGVPASSFAGSSSSGSSLIPWVFFAAFCSSVLAVVSSPLRRRAELFIVLGLVFTLLGTAITRGAYAGHHVIYVYPFPHVLLAINIVRLGPLARSARWRTALCASTASGLTALILILSVRANVDILSALGKTGGSRNFSDAVNRLHSYLSAKPDPVVAVDWGFGQNLIALSNGRIRIKELSFTLNASSEPEAVLSGSLSNPRSRYILHAPEVTNFSAARAAFFRALADAQMRPKLMRVIESRDGKPMVEVYKATPIETEVAR